MDGLAKSGIEKDKVRLVIVAGWRQIRELCQLGHGGPCIKPVIGLGAGKHCNILRRSERSKGCEQCGEAMANHLGNGGGGEEGGAGAGAGAAAIGNNGTLSGSADTRSEASWWGCKPLYSDVVPSSDCRC